MQRQCLRVTLSSSSWWQQQQQRTAAAAAAVVVNNCRRRFLSHQTNHFVKIVEVGPRDGLQNEPTLISVEDKVDLITRLANAGCHVIEAGSFVSPTWVPQMADSQHVMKALHDWRSQQQQQQRNTKTSLFSCLVPNRQGLEQAMACQALDEVAIFASASPAFSQRNLNCTIEDSMERFALVAQECKNHQIPLRGYVSCVVACPYSGPVAPAAVAHVVEQLLQLGCHEISLGDTIGVGTPGTTRAMLDAVKLVAKPHQLAVHYHDTYGQALANILVALDQEITTIDSSVAGLGGCPYAKGASGNVATEDVVYMLHGTGMNTGIDLEALVDAGDYVCRLLKRDNQSKVARAILAKREGEADE